MLDLIGKSEPKRLFATLVIAWLLFAEWSSFWWPQLTPCIVIADSDNPNYQPSQETCATFHVALIRFFFFLLDTITHDHILAAGTVLIALFTFTLWRSTKHLWEVTSVTAKHIQRVERAYINGGFGARGYGFATDGSWLIHARATMANYGKTPGFIRRIAIGVGRIGNLPANPVYQREVDVLDLYFPGMKMQDVRQTGALVEIPADGNHAVFLRVFYTDILDDTREHFSGSIYRLFLGQDADENIAIFDQPILPGSAYWDWDREK